MELIRKNFLHKLKNFIIKISDDNLFLLSSSISYYSAVAIAPFLLILLGISSLIGENVQGRLVKLAWEFSPEVGKMTELIFANVNEGINLGSVSGIVGVVILFFTASVVFIQMRFSMDVIYGFLHHRGRKSIWETVLEKLFAMFIVFVSGIFLIVSSSIPGIMKIALNQNEKTLVYYLLSLVIHFLIYVIMFWGVHYFSPSERPRKRDSLMMSVLSAIFFVIGNTMMGYYFRGVGTSSIYGAAASLLVFLIWTYYSTFTLFLSVEIFLFYKKMKIIK